ncbi:MAG: dipeptidase [Bacteroidales bacterium]|nr:dipeptidase [Lachnoclostridium sp.]MCM1384959.1 dipeptidase [Lachnoclostridium sp.]MCM1465847.1 dipeptidase [Bacteroidales bacterium]
MKIIDMHCDTISELAKIKKESREQDAQGSLQDSRKESLRENNRHVDLLRMKESGYLLQNFALFVDVGALTPSCEETGEGSQINPPCKDPWAPPCKDPWGEVSFLYKVYQEEMAANSDLIAPVLKYEDIAANEAAGKMSAMLTVEEGAVCMGEISKLKELYRMGVRMMTLSWNYPNELCHPNLDSRRGKQVWALCRELKESNLKKEAYVVRQKTVQEIFESYFYMADTENGLAEKGREFVAQMQEMGMIVDVSHMSDAGFKDVLAITKKPFVASHSNARSICRCSRNLTDDMIRQLGSCGGCMGLNFCADFLKEMPVGKENPGAIEDVVRHARHISNVGGIAVLGLGSDFDGIDTNEGLPGAQSMGRLWEALHKSGYTQRELDKIFYGNVMRVYEECL